jgi:nitroreductase
MYGEVRMRGEADMEFMQVIKKRKSFRKYIEKQISEGELQQILFAGCAAPISRKDYDSIKLTVVQDKTMLGKISAAADSSADLLYHVPTLIIISTTKAAVEHVEYFNVACIVENMLLAATNLKIGSIYLTYFLLAIRERKDLLKELAIPEGYTPISAVGLGYIPETEEWTENNDVENRIQVEFM